MKFCDKLSSLRKTNNLSQEQLAEKMKVSRQAVSKWEAGTSYPDMDKILQLCKILNCKLEDLMDDGVIGDINPKENKLVGKFKQFLNTIAKIYNMFCSMTFKEKIKCLLEIFIIGLIILIIGVIVYSILEYITYSLVELIPFNIGTYLSNILEVIYLIILIVIGAIIIFYLFKIRYLDYFVVVDKKEENKIIEKQNKVKIENKPIEKIIIRDPKDSTTSFINIIKKIFLIALKIFLIICVFPIICIFISMLFISVISIYHIQYSTIFVYFTIIFVAISLIGYIFLEFIYNFIFNRKQPFKRIFIMFILSILVIGAFSGVMAMDLMNFKYLDNNDDLKVETNIEYIEINNNTHLCLLDGDGVAQYIIDDSLNNIKVDITYLKGFNYEIEHQVHEIIDGRTSDEYYVELTLNSLNDIYELLIDDVKKKQIRNYDLDDLLEIKVYLSQKNYDILKLNDSCLE